MYNFCSVSQEMAGVWQNRFRVFVFFHSAIFLFLSVSVSLYAETSELTVSEFRGIAEELSHKVELFRDAWNLDPHAEFFGGTTRDYLYWLKKQFRGKTTRSEIDTIKNQLRSKASIDIRDFVIGESDVDIVSVRADALRADVYGIRKIDNVSVDRFDPNTEMGKNELNQGYLPVEKIRLSKKGFVSWNGFGDGIKEIFYGKPTMVRATKEQFSQTHFAKQNLNHEVLLAFRYLRILGVNYYYEHGSGYPNQQKLNQVDQQSFEALRAILMDAVKDPKLKDCFQNQRFQMWANAMIHKAFRSYTNPTATHQYFVLSGADQIVRQYSDFLEPINQYLFAKNRLDLETPNREIVRFHSDPEHIFLDSKKVFPDGRLYHGTRTDLAFRNILHQGVLPSKEGMGGTGLYGVAIDHIDFATKWGGDVKNVVSFKVKENARIVDVTQGDGKRLLAAFAGSLDEFCDHFAIDIVLYPYSVPAFVVKNSSVLERPEGQMKTILNFERALEKAGQIQTKVEFERFVEELKLGNFRNDEKRLLYAATPLMKKLEHSDDLIRAMVDGFEGSIYYSLREAITRYLWNPYSETEKRAFENFLNRWIDHLLGDPRPKGGSSHDIDLRNIGNELNVVSNEKVRAQITEMLLRTRERYEGIGHRIKQGLFRLITNNKSEPKSKRLDVLFEVFGVTGCHQSHRALAKGV